MRRVETTESYAGGHIVLPDVVRERIASQQAEILAVGEPAYCEDEFCERPHLSSITVEYRNEKRHRLQTHRLRLWKGDWVLVAPRSLVECGDSTGQTYLVNQDDVIAVLSS